MKNAITENYKKLLFAIKYSDEKEKKKTFCVYDTQDSDRLLAVFNSSKNCAKFFKVTEHYINLLLKSKTLKNNRYRIEKFNNIDTNKKI